YGARSGGPRHGPGRGTLHRPSHCCPEVDGMRAAKRRTEAVKTTAAVAPVSGPRIYNLFPLLVGRVSDWQRELPRIAGMGFDWVYLNPFTERGFSGSLYAVKDPSRLDPLFRDEDGRGD